ncbi:MAG: hypothetical protein WBF90_07445 [Rivularia sp. (in: cyanobacteria)]
MVVKKISFPQMRDFTQFSGERLIILLLLMSADFVMEVDAEEEIIILIFCGKKLLSRLG